MSKRFIDTNLFNDEWVCGLSKDAKLFFIYYITTCDHAGVLRLNTKLCEFQTGLKSLTTVIKELGDSLVRVKEGLYFMPRFIRYQYPNFPQSTVMQQVGAISILTRLGLWDVDMGCFKTVTKESQTVTKESQTLAKESIDSYVNVNDNVIEEESENFKKENDPHPQGKLRGFDKFWKLYPKRQAKGNAEKAWIKISINNDLFHTIMRAVGAQIKSDDWLKDEGRFIPHPATWLNSKGWENETETTQPEKTERERIAARNSFYSIGPND